MNPSLIRRWKEDPVVFINQVLRNPETGQPYVFYPAEEEFVREAVKLDKDGRLLYPEVLFSGPKKIGKTTLAAIMTNYVIVVLGGRYAEGYCIANDFEQSQGRVFQQVKRIIEASPDLNRSARILSSKIEFPSTGATITALACDYQGAAGANPTITVFDELWGYVSEASHRLWDEMVPVPTRKISMRLTVTYAGFEGESDLLWNLHQRGLQGVKEA